MQHELAFCLCRTRPVYPKIERFLLGRAELNCRSYSVLRTRELRVEIGRFLSSLVTLSLSSHDDEQLLACALKMPMQRPVPEEQFDPCCEAEARGNKQAKSMALKLLRHWRVRTHIAAEIFNSRLKRGHFCGYDHGSQDSLIEGFLAAKRQVG